MALSAWGLRKFLIRQPKPSLVRLTSGTKSDDIVPKKNQSYSRLGETIAAVAPELVEVFDAEGNLLRACRPQSDADPNEAPETPQLLQADPETARLTHFANLIHRAYEHSTNVAFTKMVELVERLDARAEAIEARLERAEVSYRKVAQQQVNDALDRADELVELAEEEGGDQLGTLVRAFLQGNARAQTKRTNGKTREP